MQTFRRAVAANFQPLCRQLGLEWRIASPWVEGFSTSTVQMTVGVYHGHFPSVSVKFRLNLPSAPLGTDDENMFGLGWVEAFVSGHTPLPSREKRLTPETIDQEVEALAAKFVEFALPLLTAPDTNWANILSFVRGQISDSTPPLHGLR
jgi:hypothetical protein